MRAKPALIALILGGVALRVVACVAVWPVGLGLWDSGVYAQAAARSPLWDVHAPAGYSAFLAAVGLLTHQIAVVVLLQHALGVAAAIVVFAAVRRATGSEWLGLIPAAVVLLDGDQIYLEHNIMAEGITAPLMAGVLYAGVRVLERPRSIRWALGLGLLVGATAITRSAGIALVGIIVLALMVRSPVQFRQRLTAACAAGGSAILILVGYGFANLAYNDQFELGPKPGWHLYGMVAHYADCRSFTPPQGTRPLCESAPSSARPGINFYLWSGSSPGHRTFGWLTHDTTVGAFAEQVVLHQPGQYLGNVADNLLAYFAPSLYPSGYGGVKLGTELDWSRRAPDEAQTATVLARFFSPFHPQSRSGPRAFLGTWQRVFRFGPVPLLIATLLTLAGLVFPERRALLILFGGAGICLLIIPSFIGDYVGRYSVPLIAPMAASAAIAGDLLWRRASAFLSSRRLGSPVRS